MGWRGVLRSFFTVRTQLGRRDRFILGALAVLLLLGLWSALTYSGRIPELYLPTPTALLASARELMSNPSPARNLPHATAVSLERTLKALGITAVIGIPLGLLMGSIPALDGLLAPTISAAKAIPATAFVGLVILVFGIEEPAKTAFLVLGAVFFMILMVRNAVLNVREAYVRTARDIGVSGWQMIAYVLLPGALPEIWESIIICNGIMWTYIVIAEYTNAQSGLGALIRSSEKILQSAPMYVSMITIALVAVGTDAVLRWVQRQWFPWKDK